MTTTTTAAAEVSRSQSETASEEHFLISMIEVGERHRKDFGDLDELASSITKQGLLQPIGINQDYELVFGERRLRACRDILKWEMIPVRFVDVESILDGEVDENAMRKSFTVTELVSIVDSMRSFAHGGDRRSDQTRTSDDEGLTIDQAAKRVGLGNKDTFYRAKSVVEKGIDELVGKMDRGDIAVAVAAEIATESPEQQRVILADTSVPLTVKKVKSKKSTDPKDRWEKQVAKAELEAGLTTAGLSTPPSDYKVTVTAFTKTDTETIESCLSNWLPKTKLIHGSQNTSNVVVKCSRDEIQKLLQELGDSFVKCGQIRLVVEQ